MNRMLTDNMNPAKMFMGDTGSLGLGTFLAALALLYGNVWVACGVRCCIYFRDVVCDCAGWIF